jgi:hypothetical protein
MPRHAAPACPWAPHAAEYPEDVFSNGQRRPCVREVLHNLTDQYPADLDIRNITRRRGLQSKADGGFVPLLEQQHYRWAALPAEERACQERATWAAAGAAAAPAACAGTARTKAPGSTGRSHPCFANATRRPRQPPTPPGTW